MFVHLFLSPEGGSNLRTFPRRRFGCRAVPKRGSADTSRSAQLQFAARVVRLGPVLGRLDLRTVTSPHAASFPAPGTARSKLKVFSSSWPSSSRPNHTLCFPPLDGSSPTDQPANALEMNTQRLPQLMLPHLATFLESIASYFKSSGVPSYLRSDWLYTSTGHFIPNASCGRSWLKVFRHSSKPACCSARSAPRSSRSTSKCSRSCPPLSCGHPGRPRSRSIPKTTHQADKRLNPSTPWSLAKGAPLSLRIASGIPCCSKSRSKQPRTVWPRALAMARRSSTYRENSSRTVNGSQRLPRANHHPLKSTVHTSLGTVALRPLNNRPDWCRGRNRRGCTKPARSSTRLKLLSLGISSCKRSYTLGILRGPQCRCFCLSRMISHTTASSKPSGLLLGRRDSSLSPLNPHSKNRSFHLYPVLVLISYSRHNSRKFSVLIAFNTNSVLWFIGSTCFHGIGQFIQNQPASVTHVLNHLCYLCIEPGPI